MVASREICVENRWVSERHAGTWKTVEEYVLFLKQKKAYEFAADLSDGARVLDFGCGSGYGAALLASRADQVVGVDVDGEVIEYCSRRYRKPNLTFQEVAPNYSLPFQDGVFDVVVSFQVIEHIREVPAYLRELKRVLASRGVLLITTPNRRHRLLSFQKPWNPEHYREYDPKRLRKELTPFFPSVCISGINGNEAIRAVELKRVHRLRFDSVITAPLLRTVKAVMPPRVIAELKRLRATLAPRRDGAASPGFVCGSRKGFTEKYNLAGFCVNDGIKGALDILAVCCTV